MRARIAELCGVPRRARRRAASRRCWWTAADGGVVALRAARRSRAERGQGAEAARRRQSAAHGERRAGARRPPAANPGSIGPIGFPGTIYVDHAAAAAGRLRLRRQREGRALHRRELGPRPAGPRTRATSATCRPAIRARAAAARCEIARGIEVGHIFQLGQLYSEAMKASVLDEHGKARHDVHGLLRHRRDPRRGRRHRAESRCQRHHLARADRALPAWCSCRSTIRSPSAVRRGRRPRCTREFARGRHRRAARRPRRAAGREVRRCGAASASRTAS